MKELSAGIKITKIFFAHFVRSVIGQTTLMNVVCLKFLLSNRSQKHFALIGIYLPLNEHIQQLSVQMDLMSCGFI